MRIPRFAAWMLSLLLMVAGSAPAQDFPNKPLRIVGPEPGGNGDFNARVAAQGLTSQLGQQVIVENRGGVASIPALIVVRASPDGYTLLVYSGTLWIGPLLQKMPYDPVRDLAPVTLLTRAPNILVVHPSSPIKSVKELIDLAKAKPGVLNYGSAESGSSSHIATELFMGMAGVNMTRITYKGSGPALTATIGGEVQVMFGSASSVAPHVKSGRLRALAVSSPQPTPLAPGLPTIASSGVPGYESGSLQGLWAPAKTPAAIIKRLNQAMVYALRQSDIKERFLNAGLEPVGSTPEESAAMIKADIARMSKVIKDAGIRVE